MEEDIVVSHASHNKSLILQRLKAAVEVAEETIQYDTAHNPEILYALEVVKNFIQRKKRVCYGGTAINAILPAAMRFYNPELDLPDYDFFTPDQEADIRDIVSDLRKAGFKDIYHRQGIHEGTYKILVNFIAVADITAISQEVFDVFKNRAIVKGGVYYTDPDILRFLMYLELGRPKGMVSRWEKVYERLALLNRAFPFRKCRGATRKWAKDACIGSDTCTRRASTRGHMNKETRNKLYDFLISKERVIISEEYKTLYKFGHKHATPTTGPIIFISPEPEKDAYVLRQLLKGNKLKIYKRREIKENLPERIYIFSENRPMVAIIREVSCQAYTTLKLDSERKIHIGTPDTILTSYLSLYIFEKHYARIFTGEPLPCLIQHLLTFSEKNRAAKRPIVDPFPVVCEGYQKGFPTLLKEKVQRGLREKGGIE